MTERIIAIENVHDHSMALATLVEASSRPPHRLGLFCSRRSLRQGTRLFRPTRSRLHKGLHEPFRTIQPTVLDIFPDPNSVWAIFFRFKKGEKVGRNKKGRRRIRLP